MKMHIFSKIGCGVMIGFLVPLSAVQAADPNDRIQANLGEGGVTYARDASSSESKRNDAWSSQGAQGPIRSDMTADKTADSQSEAKFRQMEKQLYPLNPAGG